MVAREERIQYAGFGDGDGKSHVATKMQTREAEQRTGRGCEDAWMLTSPFLSDLTDADG